MPKNIGLYNNNLSVPRKQDVDAVQEQVNEINQNLSNFVTSQDPSGIVNTIPPTFGGYTTDDFVLKADVVNSLTSSEIQSPLSANQGRILNESILANTSNITNLLGEISNKVDINGATMLGALIAQSNTNYSVGQVRNIYLSTSEPTTNVGNNGDIWIVYEV